MTKASSEKNLGLNDKKDYGVITKIGEVSID